MSLTWRSRWCLYPNDMMHYEHLKFLSFVWEIICLLRWELLLKVLLQPYYLHIYCLSSLWLSLMWRLKWPVFLNYRWHSGQMCLPSCSSASWASVGLTSASSSIVDINIMMKNIKNGHHEKVVSASTFQGFNSWLQISS